MERSEEVSSTASDAMCDSGMSETKRTSSHLHSCTHNLSTSPLTVHDSTLLEVLDVGVQVVEEARKRDDVIAQSLVALCGRLWRFGEVVDGVRVDALAQHCLAQPARGHNAPLQHGEAELEEAEARSDCRHVTRHRRLGVAHVDAEALLQEVCQHVHLVVARVLGRLQSLLQKLKKKENRV